MKNIAEDLWVEERDLRFLGVETGTRMTVIRLSDGSLFVHSPVALDGTLKAFVEQLGPVKAIVAPSLFHHLYVGPWMQAFPHALVCCTPGLEKKRPELHWHRVLSDVAEPEWEGELEQVYFAARKLENEVVFFHRKSRTIVCSDLLFHLSSHRSGFTRFVAFLLGNRKPGATFLERFLIRDRKGAREQISRMLQWNPERIILAHGEMIESDGLDVLRNAYAWL